MFDLGPSCQDKGMLDAPHGHMRQGSKSKRRLVLRSRSCHHFDKRLNALIKGPLGGPNDTSPLRML